MPGLGEGNGHAEQARRVHLGQGGRSVFNPHNTRVRSYEVTVEPAAGLDDDEQVETYPVSVEDGFVVLHI
jgi:nitrite reductase/ring-hydroxylating ferredoxin subunit